MRIDHGARVASYAAFSKQCGWYVLPGAITEHADEIAAAGLKATKTGITFSPRRPIPDDLVERLARASGGEASAGGSLGSGDGSDRRQPRVGGRLGPEAAPGRGTARTGGSSG